MQNITTVIFDLGRVMVRLSTDGKDFGELMRGFGIEPARAFEQYWCKDEVNRHMTGELSPRGFYEKAAEFLKPPMTYERFAECWCDLFAPMPGMKELFNEVAENHKVGILSDCDPLHWGKIQQMMPWLGRVEKPTLSFEAGCLKPDPRIYAAAARNSGSAMEECLFIDDVAGNAEGAGRCGMQAVHFTGADDLRGELRRLRVL